MKKWDVKMVGGDRKTLEADEIQFSGGTLMLYRREANAVTLTLLSAWAPGTWSHVQEAKP